MAVMVQLQRPGDALEIAGAFGAMTPIDRRLHEGLQEASRKNQRAANEE